MISLFLAITSHKDVSKSRLTDEIRMGDDDEDEEDDEESDALGPDGCLSAANQYQRRRSRAVLYQLSGHYRRSVTVKSKLKLNNVRGSPTSMHGAAR